MEPGLTHELGVERRHEEVPLLQDDGPVHPLGSGVPSARTAAAGEGVPLDVPVEGDVAVGGALGEPWVHAPAKKESARSQRSVRMPMLDGTPMPRG